MRIVIPLYEGFTALDAVGPYEVLVRLPGAQVLFAAERPGPVRDDKNSLSLVAEAALAELPSCELLLVPGGPAARREIDRLTPLVDWIRDIHPSTTWTTSVCTGSLLLGAAGLLRGLSATTHWGATEILAGYGASYTDARVVRQGKIVTAAGVSSGIDMALTLAGEIAGDELAKAVQLQIEYDPQPPYDTGSVAKAGPQVMARLSELTTRRA